MARSTRNPGALVGLFAAVVSLCTATGCTGSSCADTGCPSGQVCIADRCRTACIDDSACADREVCFQGYCELGDRRPGLPGDGSVDPDGAGDPGAGDGGPGDPGPGDPETGDPGPPGCGNNSIDAGEACDGTALGANSSCELAGWSGGTIGCMVTCVLHDLSGCTGSPGNCNGVGVAGRQQCDGPELRGESCESLGFLGGTLDCTSECAYDVSGCTPP